ncbi:MAG TPA: PilZ domain-containing protein [Terriglobales bacterium]|jgi:ActR/RegA family two-component response regulator|nr:PilZ domain-containing protein [Terriglobales bacterium]
MPIAIPAATLEFLLVSSDSSTAGIVQAALEAVGGEAEHPSTLEAACELIVSRKVDGVILDVDLKTALDLIARMRRTKNARAFAFVCVKSEAEAAIALKGGATAFFAKPLNVKSIARKISSFKSIILTERRRYQRFEVTLPVVITLGDIGYPGLIENISQGGIAVRLPCLLPSASFVDFSFDLDSGATIEGCAQLRWASPDGLTGMEFRIFPPKSKDDLMAWLRQKASAPPFEG